METNYQIGSDQIGRGGRCKARQLLFFSGHGLHRQEDLRS